MNFNLFPKSSSRSGFPRYHDFYAISTPCNYKVIITKYLQIIKKLLVVKRMFNWSLLIKRERGCIYMLHTRITAACSILSNNIFSDHYFYLRCHISWDFQGANRLQSVQLKISRKRMWNFKGKTLLNRHVFVKHWCPRRQRQNMAKSLSPKFWPRPTPRGMMSVKCEQPLDELTVQVWLQSKFDYCMTTQTLNIALWM